MKDQLPLNIGILGGGQLARMLALSAYELGLNPFLFVKSELDCAVQVCHSFNIDDGTDECLTSFAKRVDFLVIESEFVSVDRIEKNTDLKKMAPSLDCLRRVQNKFHQKKNLKKFGIPTLDFIEVSSVADLQKAAQKFNNKMVLKKAEFGYDGRGTWLLKNAKDIEQHIEILKSSETPFVGYAEEFAEFKKELSVLVARNKMGEIKVFPVIETHQAKGMCLWALAPAPISSKIEQRARKIGIDIVRKFKGTGIFGVEMFLLKNGEVVVNEIAPRVHNSGHMTMNGFNVSQFEQHLRAVTGMPLIEPIQFYKKALMYNIIGTKRNAHKAATDIRAKFNRRKMNTDKIPLKWIHWYGKSGESSGRKLGHINIVSDKGVHEILKIGKKMRTLVKV